MVVARAGHRQERTVPNAKIRGPGWDRPGRDGCRGAPVTDTSRQAKRKATMIITKMHLSRRTVLRGLGATLALPLLDSMVPALTALDKTVAAPVRRFGVFYVPNGMSMPYWFPKTVGPLAELPPTLRSLTELKDRVLLMGGLADEPANLVKGGGDHARSAGTFLTGVPFKFTAGADVFGSVSMDQIAAREMEKETQLASLELGIESNAMIGSCDGG